MKFQLVPQIWLITIKMQSVQNVLYFNLKNKEKVVTSEFNYYQNAYNNNGGSKSYENLRENKRKRDKENKAVRKTPQNSSLYLKPGVKQIEYSEITRTPSSKLSARRNVLNSSKSASK